MPSGLIQVNNTTNASGENSAGFVDSSSVLLANGDVLITPVAPATFGGTVLFNPVSNTLFPGPNIENGGNEDEATMVKLPDDSILTIDFYSETSERYIPALNRWIDDSNSPDFLYDAYGKESGAAFLLPNGKAFFIGSTPATALYTPTGNTNAGSWTDGPNIPGNLGAPDAPAAMMVNGKILCALSPTPFGSASSNIFTTPTYFFEYDYSQGSIGAFTQVHAPNGSFTNGEATFPNRMLDLPDGTVLFTGGGTQLYVYKPDASPLTVGKPAIQSVSWNPDGTVHLTGTGFNGISQGASYGDDAQMDSNFPLLRFTDANGKVSYGSSSNWNSTSLMTGSRVVTTDAVLPANIHQTHGTWSLQVVANGNASAAVTFNPLFAGFNPLTNGEAVFDFSQIGGLINESGAVVFRMEQYDASNANALYWNGSSWIADGNNLSVYLAATITGGIWAPTAGVTLPARGQISYGPFISYILLVNAVDIGGNSITNQILVTRSVPDTSTPLVTLDNILNGQVLTNATLPGLSGSALDNGEAGVAVASVNVYLNRFTGSGALYWNGSSWSSTPAVLTATYNAPTVAWQVTNSLPSGANLPNAGYQVQIVAANNESPAGNTTLTVGFSLNYHPNFTFTYGSQFGLNPNRNWSDPANWDVGAVPTPDALVIITNYSSDNTDMGSLQLYGLNMSGGALATAGMLITNLNLSGGQLLGGAISLPTNGVFNWSGGTVGGVCTVPAGATISLTGSADKSFYVATLNNNGSAYWNGGNIVASCGSVINNNATFVIQSSGFFYDNAIGAGSYSIPSFVNNGWLQKTNSNGVTIVAPDDGGWTFDQNGTIDVENGAFSSQSLFNLNGSAIFAGPGETRVDAGTTTITGANTIQQGATFELAAGTLNGDGSFAGTGTFKWTGGVIAAALNLQANTIFNMTGTSAKTLYVARLVGAGQGFWTGTGPVVCSYGSIFENDGTFTVQNDSSFSNNAIGAGSYSIPSFVNNGLFIKTNGANTTLFDSANGGVGFNNQGTVNVQSGILTLAGGGNDAAAAFTVAAGSQIDLSAGPHNFTSGPINFNGPGLIRLFSAGSLSLDNVMVNFNTAPIFEVDPGGIVNGTGTFGGTGTFNWTGGVIAAALTLQTNITLNLTGAASKTLSVGLLASAGQDLWTGTGPVVCSYGSIFQNDGVLTVQNDSSFSNNAVGAGSYNVPAFVNNGTLRKNTATGTTAFIPDNGGVTFNQNGTIDVESGVLSSQSQFNVNGGAIFAGPGETRVDAGAITVNGSNTIQLGARVELAGGAWSGASVLTGPGTLVWSGGTITGNTTIGAGANLSILGSGPKNLNVATLAIAGHGLWTGAGSVVCTYGSIFENDGAFTVQNDSSFSNNGVGAGSYNLPAFVNNGSVVKNTTTGLTVFPANNGGVAFDNNGSITIQTGNLSLGGGGAGNDGSFAGAAGSHIDLVAGTFSPAGNLSFSGAGSTRVNGGTVTFGNSISTMVAGGAFELLNGIVGGINSFAGTGIVNWSGGAISGSITLQPNITFNLTSSADKTLSVATLNNNGTAYWTGGNIVASYGTVINNNATFVIQSGGSFYDNAVGAGSYSVPAFVNNGTFRKNTTTGTAVFAPNNGGVNFNNNGTVNLQTGSLAIDGGYALSGSPRLNVALGGANPGSQFTQETFAGPAALGGILDVTLANGFSPTNGQSFAIVTYGSESGQFASQQLPALPNNLTWQVTYGATALTLNVVGSTAVTITNATRLANGHFQFSLSGSNASSAVIQGSTNLLIWTSLATNAPFTGSFQYDDAQAVNYRVRFYRVLTQP